jgi:hypothetical protein
MKRRAAMSVMGRRTRPSYVQHAFKGIKQGPLLSRQVGFGFDHTLREFRGHVFGQAGHRQHIALGQSFTCTHVDGPTRFFLAQQSAAPFAVLGPTSDCGITPDGHGMHRQWRFWTVELAFHHVRDSSGIIGAVGLVCVTRKSQGTENQEK